MKGTKRRRCIRLVATVPCRRRRALCGALHRTPSPRCIPFQDRACVCIGLAKSAGSRALSPRSPPRTATRSTTFATMMGTPSGTIWRTSFGCSWAAERRLLPRNLPRSPPPRPQRLRATSALRQPAAPAMHPHHAPRRRPPRRSPRPPQRLRAASALRQPAVPAMRLHHAPRVRAPRRLRRAARASAHLAKLLFRSSCVRQAHPLSLIHI